MVVLGYDDGVAGPLPPGVTRSTRNRRALALISRVEMGVRDDQAVLIAVGDPESLRASLSGLRLCFWRDLAVGKIRLGGLLLLCELQRRSLELAVLAKDRLRGDGRV